jgi:hypothetical protein
MDPDHFLTGGLPILIGLIFVAVFTAVTLLLTTKTDELTESPARRLKKGVARAQRGPHSGAADDDHRTTIASRCSGEARRSWRS